MQKNKEKRQTHTLKSPPYPTHGAVQGSAGSVKSIKKLPSGDLLIETATQAQSINILRCTNLSNIPITATPHKTLNSSKGVICCPDLILLPDSEIEKELASQRVEAVKRITSIKDAQKPIINNLIEQKTILSPPETSSTDLESLNRDKRSPETSHLSVPSDTEVLMEIDKSSTKRPVTDIVQEAAKILKPSIRIESGGTQTTKEVEDLKLLSKKWKSRRRFSPIKYNSEKPKGSP
ncbi:uncharacterized protein TNCV_1540931 [Trichonephila clavipes]|nr:uncharacterized protein TNCV_1540931 [Trichonephila clavipes]